MRKYDKMYPGTGGTWQGIINDKYNRLRAKRTFDPEACILLPADRFKHLALAANYRRRMYILRDLLSRFELLSHRRCARYHLHVARYQCPRPKLP